MKYYYLFFFIFILASCKNENKKSISSEKSNLKTPELTIKTNDKGAEIIEKLEENTAAKKREISTITYLFNQDTYQINRNCGWYEFTQKYADSEKTDSLVLDNMEISQYSKGKAVEDLSTSTKRNLRKEMKTKLFFAELIFGLNSPAVQKKYLQEEKINEEEYHKVKLEFIEENYEEDYLVEAVFWINKTMKKPEFIAVNFEEDKSEKIFLKPINQREIEGVSFFDYQVFTADKNKKIEEMAQLFEEEKLQQKEELKYENIEVVLSDENCD